MLSLCSSTQKHPGKDQDCRLDLQAGGCPFPFPTAVMPPQRQFLLLAPCRLTASGHQCWEPWHSFTEDAASLQLGLLQSHRKRLSLLTVPQPKSFFFQGLFHFPELVLTWSSIFSTTIPLVFHILFSHLHGRQHQPVALCFSTACKCFSCEICWP